MCVCVFVCHTEQLEAFKKHMEAGETNTPAIIMGEENEEDTDNSQLNDSEWVCVSVSVYSKYMVSYKRFVFLTIMPNQIFLRAAKSVFQNKCLCYCVCTCRREGD